jgi:hypothetical protein
MTAAWAPARGPGATARPAERAPARSRSRAPLAPRRAPAREARVAAPPTQPSPSAPPAAGSERRAPARLVCFPLRFPGRMDFGTAPCASPRWHRPLLRGRPGLVPLGQGRLRRPQPPHRRVGEARRDSSSRSPGGDCRENRPAASAQAASTVCQQAFIPRE